MRSQSIGWQDLARAKKDETLLAQHRAFAESHSNDPSMRYLAVRAMPQGKEQDQAFIDLYERWPDNGWVCHGTAFAMTSQDRWEEALSCFETAAKEDVHSDSNICSSARIKRYLGKDDAEVFKDARRSEELSSYRDLESGASYRNTPELAYSLIHQGKLVEAARVARGKGGIVALIGCSEGATKAAQELALDCDPEEIYSEFIVIYLAALAAKNKVDPSPYLKRLESLAPSRPIVKLTKELLDSGVTDAFKERVRGDALSLHCSRGRQLNLG